MGHKNLICSKRLNPTKPIPSRFWESLVTCSPGRGTFQFLAQHPSHFTLDQELGAPRSKELGYPHIFSIPTSSQSPKWLAWLPKKRGWLLLSFNLWMIYHVFQKARKSKTSYCWTCHTEFTPTLFLPSQPSTYELTQPSICNFIRSSGTLSTKLRPFKFPLQGEGENNCIWQAQGHWGLPQASEAKDRVWVKSS